MRRVGYVFRFDISQFLGWLIATYAVILFIQFLPETALVLKILCHASLVLSRGIVSFMALSIGKDSAFYELGIVFKTLLNCSSSLSGL